MVKNHCFDNKVQRRTEMLESLANNTFTYNKLTEEEQHSRGILGRLVGVIADTENPTRNGRKYGRDL